jgi:transposase
VQYAWDRRDRLTAIAALTRAPWAERWGLYSELLDHNTRTDDVLRFLRRLHHSLRRPLLLVCDRLPAHRSAVRRLQAAGCSWLHAAWLPPYAPDLDPVENLWSQSKYGELANFIPDDISQLRHTLDDLFQEYRHDPGRLLSFFHAAHLAS